MNKKKANFEKALKSLENALALPIETERDVAGIIQMFEFVYELSWKYLKLKLENAGVVASTPREVLVKAYQSKMIDDEKLWLGMIKDRNLSVHNYDSNLADELVKKIQTQYLPLFQKIDIND